MIIAYDINGNRILKISGADLNVSRGFSIQTLGNLPDTHKHGIHYATKSEVFNFISEHGTPLQKKLMFCNVDFSLLDIVNGEKRDRHYDLRAFWRELSDSDIEQIADLTGGRHTTRRRMLGILKYNLSDFPRWWLERVTFSHGRWLYCAGQDYISEMAQIRKKMVN